MLNTWLRVILCRRLRDGNPWLKDQLEDLKHVGNEMGWACGAYGWEERVYRALVGKPEGRRPLGRPRHRWVDNIRMDFQEVGCGYMDWIGLAQDRDRWRTHMNAVMNLRVPWNVGNFLTSCKPVSFSRRTLHHGVSKTRWEYDILGDIKIINITQLEESSTE